MRTFVVAEATPDQLGVSTANVYFRVAIAGAARQAWYAARQANYVPNAPADPDPVKAANEVQAFAQGLWVELPPFSERVDPAATGASKVARLKGLLADATAKYTAWDNARFALYGAAVDDAGGTAPGGI